MRRPEEERTRELQKGTAVAPSFGRLFVREETTAGSGRAWSESGSSSAGSLQVFLVPCDFARGRFPDSRVFIAPRSSLPPVHEDRSDSLTALRSDSPATVAGPRRHSTCFPFTLLLWRHPERQTAAYTPGRMTAGGTRIGAVGLRYFRFLLKNSMVRFQARAAASLSKRGVVSLLKPCCVPGYT